METSQGQQFDFPTTKENEIFHQHLSQGRTSQAFKCFKTGGEGQGKLDFNQGLIQSVLVSEELAPFAPVNSLPIVPFSVWKSFFRELFPGSRRFPLVDRFQLLKDVIEYSTVAALEALKECRIFTSMEMNQPLPKIGYTPLTLAITEGSDGVPRMLQCLLSASSSSFAPSSFPDVNVSDAKGFTPLAKAVTLNNPSVIEWLLREAKADPKKEATSLVDGLLL